MQAAVPDYVKNVGGSFQTAPPGHRFKLYLEYWDRRWNPEKKSKKEVLGKVLDLNSFSAEIDAVRNRQGELAPEASLVFHALSSAPFVTGMGMEHPLENGFAFLDPYGLPCLPGSSVKGVVRRAAEELALFEEDSKGWSIPAVWWLFGFDHSSAFFTKDKKDKKNGEFTEAFSIREERKRWKEAFEARMGSIPGELLNDECGLKPAPRGDEKANKQLSLKGSIAFWDVVPKPADNSLRVDIMNPHYGHYYQKNEPPHDAGDPKPIFYLTIPEGSEFTFTAALDAVGGLPSWFTEDLDGKPRWQVLLEAAFEHAFEWLGFGAKTSLGYGGMERDLEADRKIEQSRIAREEEAARKRDAEETALRLEEQRIRLEAMSPLERTLEELEAPDHDRIIGIFNRIGEFPDEDQKALALRLKEWMQANNAWKVKKNKKKAWDRVAKIKTILGEA